MHQLTTFIQAHTSVHGTREAGQELPATTVDVGFFEVHLQGHPKGAQLRELLQAHASQGEFTQVDVFDGKEHGYVELGAWLGSQELALRLMGLGTLLELWQLLTPRKILGAAATDELVKELAGAGYITVVAQPQEVSA